MSQNQHKLNGFTLWLKNNSQSVNQWVYVAAFFTFLIMAFGVSTFSSGFEFFSHNKRGEVTEMQWMKTDLASVKKFSPASVDWSQASRTVKIETKLAEEVFVYRFKASETGLVELSSRHATGIDCRKMGDSSWSATMDWRRVGGSMRPYAQGFAFDAKDGEEFICAQTNTGPAKISAISVSLSDASLTLLDFERRKSIVLAGFGMLILFSLISSFINKDARQAAFAMFLLINLRLSELSIGSDWSFLWFDLDPHWMPRMRMMTTALSLSGMIGVHMLLVGDVLSEAKTKWISWWHRMTVVSITLLLLCSVFLPFKTFLPILWGVSLNLGLYLLFKTGWLAWNPSKKSWSLCLTSFILAMPMFSGLSEILAAALGYAKFVEYFNHESGALMACLMATLAFATQLRDQTMQAEKAMKALEAAYDSSPMGLFEADLAGGVTRSNPALMEMLGEHDSTGWSFAGHLGVDTWALIVDQAVLANQGMAIDATIPAKSLNGAQRWFQSKIRINEIGRVEGSLQDSTERVLHRQRLEFLASHDPLTECLNLRGLEVALDAMDNSGGDAIVAYFDLDRFKLINDVYGHEAGDSVLRQVRDRLQSALGDDVDFGRVGGDEFLALFHDMGMDSAQKRCEAALKSIGDQQFTFGSKAFKLSVSAGLVEAAAVGATHSRALIGAADSACRMAKTQGRDKLVAHGRGSMFFERRSESLEIAKLFDNGATPDGLYLLAQPIMSLRSPFESLNFEVLMRMRMADGRLIGAPSLIETAEAHGCVARLDLWMLETILNWIGANKPALAHTRFICINFSGASLNDEAFLSKAFSLMESKRWQAEMLCVEITESVALRDLDNIRSFITRARALGVRVALDDFGAGYSSFGYLKDLPADALKVDGVLVRDAMVNPASQSILVSLSGLSTALGMRSIGEWAENAEMIKMLALAGFDYAQGYAIAKPMPMDELIKVKSCADLIEDSVVMNQVRMLQSGAMLDTLAEADSKYLH